MREIKFRLRIDNRIVGYEKWRSNLAPCWLYSEDGKRWSPMYIYHTQKDQFIGLLDRNKKEIYEGDILHFPEGKPVEVKWFKYGMQYNISPLIYRNEGYTDYLIDQLKNCEVIGNKFEHPELLEKESEVNPDPDLEDRI